MKRFVLLTILLGASLVFAADERPAAPRWLKLTAESISDLRYSLQKVEYPISVQTLIEKLGLKGHATWLSVVSSGIGASKRRYVERFAISDPSAATGHYQLEMELKEVVGGDDVNQVIRARLCYVTPEGIDFYADDIETLEKNDNRANKALEPTPTAVTDRAAHAPRQP